MILSLFYINGEGIKWVWAKGWTFRHYFGEKAVCEGKSTVHGDNLANDRKWTMY